MPVYFALESTNDEGHTVAARSVQRCVGFEANDLDPLLYALTRTNPPPGTTIITKAISGKIYDANGAPVQGATVVLFRQSDDYRCKTTVTDATGLYSFPRLTTDVQAYYTVAYTLAGGSYQIHGVSDRDLVPS